jgi:hypothetical protein
LGLYEKSKAHCAIWVTVGRSTVANILKRHGIEPAPERLRRTCWREFLAAHWEMLTAADFFTVETWTLCE